MSFDQDPGAERSEIDPQLRRQALQEMEEWGGHVPDGMTLVTYLQHNLEGARDQLRKQGNENFRKANRVIIAAAFKELGMQEETIELIIKDIERHLQ